MSHNCLQSPFDTPSLFSIFSPSSALYATKIQLTVLLHLVDIRYVVWNVVPCYHTVQCATQNQPLFVFSDHENN